MTLTMAKIVSLANFTVIYSNSQLTIVNFYKVMIIFAPLCMLCLCTLLFFRVCHVCPECVDNMPPKKKIIPPANAYARLEEYVLNPPDNEIGRGVGLKIRLGDIYHCVVLMTRDLNWTDVDVKRKYFLAHGGWGPADLMLIRQMTKAELDGLKEAFSQSAKLPSEQDFNTTFLKSLSKLAGRMTGDPIVQRYQHGLQCVRRQPSPRSFMHPGYVENLCLVHMGFWSSM